jgi:CheY-like chemotaxis protein
VEDEPAVRDLFVEFLGKKHTLQLACDGKEALEILRAGQMPDLVITDLVMPNQEGIELIREIRRTRPATRIIAMSGAFAGRFLKTAELLGADATLVKPIRPEVLEQVIEDVLGR